MDSSDGPDDIDLPRAKSAIKRAENRIKIYREFKAKTTHPLIH